MASKGSSQRPSHHEYYSEIQSLNQTSLKEFQHICVISLEGNTKKHEKIAPGSIMVTCVPVLHCLQFNIWHNTTFLWYYILSTPVTWPLVSYFSFLNIRLNLKEKDLTIIRTSFKIKQRKWEPFKEKRSRHASWSGRITGIGLFSCKNIALKRIKSNNV